MVLIIRKLVLLLIPVLLLPPIYASAETVPELSAACAVVMNGDGRILYGKNENERAAIASTTKLMTALVASEQTKPDEVVRITADCCDIEGSSMYLRPGDKLRVSELLAGLLLVSGNDAATALAKYSGGSAADFVALMNGRAKLLGMENTHFVNPHGLSEDGHYSTAADMGRLMCRVLQSEELMRLCAMKSCRVGEQVLYNHNKLLGLCPGCLGGKTGYTMAAGRCLVSACRRGDTTLVCVTLAAPDDWNDHQKLYNWAFDHYARRDVLRDAAYEVPAASRCAESVRVIPADRFMLFLPKEQELTLLPELPHCVLAPVRKGEHAGTLRICCGGETVGECELVYAEELRE